jgi:hypothetical protein
MHKSPIKSINLHCPSGLSLGVISRLLHGAPDIALNIVEPFVSDDDRFATWCLALSTCSNLSSLVIWSPMGPPSFWDAPAGIKNEKYNWAKVRQLKLAGRITLHSEHENGRPNIFASAANFTQLEHLSIGFQNPQLLSLDDLRPLLDSLPDLRFLEITGVTSQLTAANIESILNTKPSLRTLIVYGPSSHALPPSVLFTIARHRLRVVCLPIYLSEATPLGGIRARRHPLTQFRIPRSAILPESTKEKLKLAEFIYRMFPDAKICSSTRQSEFEQSVKDLEVMRAYISQIFGTKI